MHGNLPIVATRNHSPSNFRVKCFNQEVSIIYLYVIDIACTQQRLRQQVHLYWCAMFRIYSFFCIILLYYYSNFPGFLQKTTKNISFHKVVPGTLVCCTVS